MEDNQSAVLPSNATLLWRLDAEYSRSMALVYVYVAMVMLTGLLGNLLVVVVYVTKFKATTTRSFIVALAVIDLISCAVGMPLDLFNLSRNYTYFPDGACKLEAMVVSFTYICSALLLLVVAADRYRQICHPWASQLSITGANRAILGCSVATSVCLVRVWMISGTREVRKGSYNWTATQCSVMKTDGTKFKIIFDGILAFLFSSGTVIMVTLYLLILSKLRQRGPKSKISSSSRLEATPSAGVSTCDIETLTTPGRGVHLEPSSSTQDETMHFDTSDSCDYDSNSVMHRLSVKMKSCDDSGNSSLDHLGRISSNGQDDEKSEYNESRMETSSTEIGPVRENKAVPSENTVQEINPVPDGSTPVATLVVSCNARQEKRQRHEAIVRKVTSTLFLVTVVFVLTFFPFLVVRMLGDLESSGSNELEIPLARSLFIRSVYLQSAVNPFIYGIRHPEFRERCRRLLRCSK